MKSKKHSHSIMKYFIIKLRVKKKKNLLKVLNIFYQVILNVIEKI